MLHFVLDTNIVLDWLVFQDARLAALNHAISAGQATILTHNFAIAELQRVLGYPQLKLPPSRQREVLQQYRHHSQFASLPIDFTLVNSTPEHFPQCRDPDDQPFLILTFQTQADALVSHDKAVLKLRRKARKFGINILDIEALNTRLNH